MPLAEQLPLSLRPLVTRNAVVINNDPDFESGARRLVKQVDPFVPPGLRPQVRRRRAVLGTLNGVSFLALLVIILRLLLFPPLSLVYSGPSTRSDLISQVVMFADGEGWATGIHPRDTSASSYDTFLLHHDQNGWIRVYTQPQVALRSIALVTPTEGWAVGDSGTVLRLANGVWSVVTPGPTTQTLRGVALTSPDEGWAVGSGGTIVHLASGVWSVVTPSPTSASRYGVALTSPTEGWAVGDSGTPLHYEGATAKETNGT